MTDKDLDDFKTAANIIGSALESFRRVEKHISKPDPGPNAHPLVWEAYNVLCQIEGKLMRSIDWNDPRVAGGK